MKELEEYEVASPVKCDGKDYSIGDSFSHKDQKVIDGLVAAKAIKAKGGDGGDAESENADAVDPAARKEQITQQMADLQAELAAMDAGEVQQIDVADTEARITAITAAIGDLDKDNEGHWISGGVPDAKALNEVLGWDFKHQVRAEERNIAWARFNTNKGDE